MAEIIAGSVAGAAELAALQGASATAAASLAAVETEIALEGTFLTSLEAAEAIELAGGPIGWVAAAVTGGLILAAAMGILYLTHKASAHRDELAMINHTIANHPSNPKTIGPSPTYPTIDPASGKPILGLSAPIIDALHSVPDSNLVSYSEIFECQYGYPFSRCRRRRF